MRTHGAGRLKPTKLADFGGKCWDSYSRTMVRIWGTYVILFLFQSIGNLKLSVHFSSRVCCYLYCRLKCALHMVSQLQEVLITREP